MRGPMIQRRWMMMGLTLAMFTFSAGFGTACDEGAISTFAPTEDHESDLGNGWIAAGQPSEARLTAVVNLGAHIISLREAGEDPYDEEGLIASLGGTFARFGVDSARYTDPAFRADLYDFIDAQMALGGLVYFHCKSSNRIGAAWALYHFERKGISSEDALALGRAAGLKSLDATIQEILTANPATVSPAKFVPTESHESALGNGWIAAGQPSEARLTEVVGLHAHIVSLRLAVEDPYDEAALIASLGGTFARFAVDSARYSDPIFRTDLYDFIDAQMTLGGLVYFHCASSNRVGAAWALYHFERKGLSAEDALAKGKAAGLESLTATVEDILAPAPVVFVPKEGHESALGDGWIAAGQPSQARLTEVVDMGAHIVSLRLEAEDPYDEPALVASLGGTFARFGVSSSRYTDPKFRTDLYDFIDAQMALGGLVYLHCASSNRVGAAWALYHFERKGLSAEDALAKGQAAGLKSLTATVKGILGLP